MRFDRSLNLIGEEAFARLRKSSVAVFGIGGVGGFVAEALARSGVEHLAIVDKDLIDESNINRQIIALDSTIGHQKVQVMQNRIREINPYARVDAYCEFYLPDNADFIDLSIFDYVVDAMDNVTAKIELIKRCKSSGVPFISAMGAANKFDPSRLKIADISQTEVCPLARIMRRELKKQGIKGVEVAFSTEKPVQTDGRGVSASMMPVPASMGLFIAAHIIKKLAGL